MNKDNKPEIVFWGIDEQDQLSHESLDEAVEEYLEDSGLRVEEMPDTLEAIGYARKKIDINGSGGWGWDCLNNLLEHLDENYSDPEGEATEATDDMKEAERVFITAVISEYTALACEEATRETVDVKKWILENRPDWLEKKINE